MPEEPSGPPAASETPEGTAAAEPSGSDFEQKRSLWQITDPHDPRLLPPWFRRAVVLVILLVILANIAVWAFGSLTSFWYTLFVAFFLGLVMEPAVNGLNKRGIKRGIGTFMVLGGLILFTVFFFAVFGNLLVTQLAGLASNIPQIIENILEWVNRTFNQDLVIEDVLDQLGIRISDLAGYAADLGLGLLNYVFSAVGAVFSLFTVLLFAFYFAADGPKLRRSIASWLPPSRQRTFLAVWEISTQKAGGYVISRLIMALVSSIFHGIVFIVIDLPYWLPMALWVGIVSQFIPTIGTYLAGALPIILALAEGDWVKAIIVLIAVIAYQQVENYYVQPRITQSTLQIQAAVAFGSVIVGATLFGATGALLAIPVVATIQSLIETYGKRYELVDELRDPGDLAPVPAQAPADGA